MENFRNKAKIFEIKLMDQKRTLAQGTSKISKH